jgi:hypothetical protein
MSELADADEHLANYKFQKGAHWDADNVRTLLQWIHISAINLDVMCEACTHYKRYIRRNAIISLVLSTLASTASLAQLNLNETENPGLSKALQVLFTIMAAIVAVSAGYIKIYQIQEKLEKAIKLQQEWTSFGSILSSELQLPLHLRKDALYLIIKHKDLYLELFKQQVEISSAIVAKVARRNGLDAHALSLSELFERVLDNEADRIGITTPNTPAPDTPPPDAPLPAIQRSLPRIASFTHSAKLGTPIFPRIEQQPENTIEPPPIRAEPASATSTSSHVRRAFQTVFHEMIIAKGKPKELEKVIQQRQRMSHLIMAIPSKRNIHTNASFYENKTEKHEPVSATLESCPRTPDDNDDTCSTDSVPSSRMIEIHT